MIHTRILVAIDEQIARLVQARDFLNEGIENTSRSSGSSNAFVGKRNPLEKRKHNISVEGRKRISEGVKNRWVEQKKAASAKWSLY